jgi:membrane-bound metal-dependent hydrolase YbcI (DUF457 family)
MVGTAVRRWTPDQTWLPLGIVVGSLLPDLDNLAVAFATLTQRPTDGLHRTFTHSLFTVAALIVGFYIVELLTGRTKWRNLGLGLGIGVLLHILLDLLIWFNGVAILWPLSSWINLWAGVSPPEWFAKLLLPLEFLFLALFFLLLARRAHAAETNADYQRTLRIWVILQLVLFVVFTPLVYLLDKGFMIPFGALYLLSLGLAIGVAIRMRTTIEAPLYYD